MALTPDRFDFGPWAVGDAIVGPAAVPYLDGGDPADFTGVTIVSGMLTDPIGLEQDVDVAISATDPSVLEYTFTGVPFDLGGIYSLTAKLTVPAGTFRTAEARFVVEAVDGWATIGDMRAEWRDAPKGDLQLWRLLRVARVQVEAFAPGPALVARPSTNLVLAQQTQARNIWNAIKTDPANQGIGDEGFVIRPFPMDWTVKNLIRPADPRHVVR